MRSKTGYKWLDRSAQLGPDSLADRSHRPDACPHATAPAVIREILQLRRAWRWGARKLHELLAEAHPGEPVPAIPTIHRTQRRLVGRFQGPVPARQWALLLAAHGPGRVLPLSPGLRRTRGAAPAPDPASLSAPLSYLGAPRADPLGQWPALCLLRARPPLATQRLVAPARHPSRTHPARQPAAKRPARAHAQRLKGRGHAPRGGLLRRSAAALRSLPPYFQRSAAP
jgi:Homeodomain-like domain